MFRFRAGRVSTVQWFDKTIKSVSQVPSPAIDNASEVKRKTVCKSKPWRLARKTKHSLRNDHFRAKYRYFDDFSSREDWREKQSTHYGTIISARNTGTLTIFRAQFSTSIRWRNFSIQRESTNRRPKSTFPSKTQNRQYARTSPTLAAQFFSLFLTKDLVNAFASIPRSSYVAKDTFLAGVKAFNTWVSCPVCWQGEHSPSIWAPPSSQIIWSQCLFSDRLQGAKLAITHSNYQSSSSETRMNHTCPLLELSLNS